VSHLNRRSVVLVDETAEPVAATDLADRAWFWPLGLGRLQPHQTARRRRSTPRFNGILPSPREIARRSGRRLDFGKGDRRYVVRRRLQCIAAPKRPSSQRDNLVGCASASRRAVCRSAVVQPPTPRCVDIDSTSRRRNRVLGSIAETLSRAPDARPGALSPPRSTHRRPPAPGSRGGKQPRSYWAGCSLLYRFRADSWAGARPRGIRWRTRERHHGCRPNLVRAWHADALRACSSPHGSASTVGASPRP
jgi:hypothetical protein